MSDEQKPVAWMVRNGVVDYQLVKRKEQADHLVADLQKRHDLSGSLSHFNAVALYTQPNPAVVKQLVEALESLLNDVGRANSMLGAVKARAALAAAKEAGL